MIKIGIFGATGYTGFEVIKRLRRHKNAELVFATSESYAGKSLSAVYPVGWDVPLIPSADAPLDAVDAVFCCLPHAASMPTVIRARNAGVRVIDLSADFRLDDAAEYARWYGVEHTAPHLLSAAVYGIPEINRAEIARTDLLANPGCYPTSVILALYPLLRENWVAENAPIIADSKSGVSGAGRKLSLKTHFVEVNENLSPYSIGRQHRHLAEMEQAVRRWGTVAAPVIFSPHLVPISQGMLSTIYVSLNRDTTPTEAQSLFEQAYAAEKLMRVLPPGELATFAHTRRTDGAAISVTVVSPRQLILCSSIDNLGKGAAGQAMQNFNVMFGLEETEGLLT
ncbi:MAG TPA: N-acetyl-gamma-glutamyl-phosphate reductase [Anaerolineae bacterium]|nr:N-acetyl-gamma-glutamyl-phosphate reductase [Anaerolineae bacterium]